jgi:hypothetical protein
MGKAQVNQAPMLVVPSPSRPITYGNIKLSPKKLLDLNYSKTLI